MTEYVRSESWSDIVTFYRGLVEQDRMQQGPMLRLVEQLAASRFAQGLFGATSHHTLMIAQAPRFDPQCEVLHIEFAAGKFSFKFVEQPYVERRWNKECGPDEGFSALEHFLVDLKKWFP